MSKLVVLGDQHVGVRNGSPIFHEHFRKFYSEVFFPYIDKNNISTVIGLGDFFDKRKGIDYLSLNLAKEIWFDELKKRNISHHMILGNHDLFFKSTLEVNSPSLNTREYDNVIIYDKPTDVEFDGTTITMMPWICQSNYDECMSHIKDTKSQILFGHLEVEGFKMYRNSTSHGGMKREIFSKFDVVCSGHFHHKNGIYLGAPMEYNWNDFDDPRGFHVFDTSTRELEYIVNPYKIHHRIDWDDEYQVKEDYSDLKNCFLKIVVHEKNDFIKFEKFIEKIEESGLADYQVLENRITVDLDEVSLEEGIEDTLETLKSVTDELEEDSKELYLLLENVYKKALEV